MTRYLYGRADGMREAARMLAAALKQHGKENASRPPP